MVFQQSLLSQSANVNKKDITLIPPAQYLSAIQLALFYVTFQFVDKNISSDIKRN